MINFTWFSLLMKKASALYKAFFFLLTIFSFVSLSSDEEIEKAKEFTINFENVSILEYVNFVNKVTGNNFIYDVQDLNFSVSIISKDPITKQSVMSTLIQILRIHNLNITQDENSYIISTSENARELAKVASSQEEITTPYVTRIFSIKNAKAETIAAIIRPMISPNSLLEISIETRQLIITDVVTNIDKINDLIQRLDSDENPLEVSVYDVKSNPPKLLIPLLEQIILPLTQGNPFILVPQDNSNSIFIVSTPMLAKKAQALLASLDIPAKTELKTLEHQKLFIYRPINRSKNDLKNALEEISSY